VANIEAISDAGDVKIFFSDPLFLESSTSSTPSHPASFTTLPSANWCCRRLRRGGRDRTTARIGPVRTGACQFLTTLTKALPAGLVSQLGVSLDVSEAMAGQWISIYAWDRCSRRSQLRRRHEADAGDRRCNDVVSDCVSARGWRLMSRKRIAIGRYRSACLRDRVGDVHRAPTHRMGRATRVRAA